MHACSIPAVSIFLCAVTLLSPMYYCSQMTRETDAPAVKSWALSHTLPIKLCPHESVQTGGCLCQILQVLIFSWASHTAWTFKGPRKPSCLPLYFLVNNVLCNFLPQGKLRRILPRPTAHPSCLWACLLAGFSN